MAKFSPVLLSKIDKDKHGFSFHCPGCGCAHYIQVNPKYSPCWQFNNDWDKPTVKPSIRVKSGYVNGVPTTLCHSFVTDGFIRYLDDCTHALAGKTVELPDF
jgi:hypothetical protein